METQKYRINRDLTGTTWTIPCSGTTDVWPMNTSTNCSGTTVKNSTCKDIFNYVNGDTNDFPEDLKECSPTIPCIILWDCGSPSIYSIPLTTNIKCSNLEGYNYVKFTGLRVTYAGIPIQDNFKEVKKVMTIARNNNTTPVPTVPKTDCDCENPLNDISHKIQIYLSQDFNDIGHYDLWDGNLSQRDLFANFTISGDSSGYIITLTNTMNYSYYDELAPFTYTVDWGHGTPVILPSTTSSISKIYPGVTPQQRTVKLIQDSPWGPMTSSKLLTLPLNGYAQMVGQAYVPGDVNDPGTGIGPNQINVSGMAGDTAAGSSAYHARYPDFPLDSATNIEQFSGMSFTGLDCYIVTGVTESVLGNFQSYTNQQDPFLPPGYLLNVWVPIGGDVVNPLNNVFTTGMYGVITTATTTYTAYTVSSSFGATNNNADGDTPITFYDFSNGITIFEADSCGLDKRAFGALACIDCPVDDCEWCETKDEYYDRIDQVNIQIPTINNRQTWIPHPVVDYVFGDLVYDETYNSCCCFIAVKDITSSDDWYGKPPSTSNEGKFDDGSGNEVHVWEACSYDCINCGLGTQTPCNDTTAPGWTGEVYGVTTTYFDDGDYVEDEHGNCYEALNTGTLAHPTGSTFDWDYVGCVSWICPSDITATECEMISGPQQGGFYGEITYQGCMDNLTSPNGCFPPQYACPVLYDCVGCVQINITGPNSNLYNTPSAFSSMSQCVDYCNPLAWSCSTPTSSNCCFELSCDNNTQSLYLSTVGTNLIPGSSPTPASNGQLISFKNTYDIYVGPLYNENSCVEECCVNTHWEWSCGEEACALMGGPPNGINAFATSAACEIYTLTLSQYSGQNATNLEDIVCGWNCVPQDIECVYQPCIPCYWDGCGFNEVACNTICSANTTCGCWHCDCEGGYSVDGGDCNYFFPCDGATGNLQVTGQTWVSWVVGYIGTVPGPNPAYNTFTSETECYESCECDVGWDCFNDFTGGTIGMCTSPGSIQVMEGLGYTFSDSTPGFTGYTTFEECCENTLCCHGECRETNEDGTTYYLSTLYEQIFYNTMGGILGASTPNNPYGYGLTTTYPCIWSFSYFPIPIAPQPTCNDPGSSGYVYDNALPWCTLAQCVDYALISDPYDNVVCAEPPGTCDCACGSHPDFSGSTGGWNGSNLFGYDLGYAVSWADADTNNCCFICTCPNLGTDWTIMSNVTYAIGIGQSAMDCNLMEPDLDPVTQGLGPGIINCWESCNKAPIDNPSPSDTVDDCDDCVASETYYECTPNLGCVASTCIDPATSIYCYTSSTCDDLNVGYSSCDSSCFCNGLNTSNCTDTCITAEIYNSNPWLFNFLNTCPPFNFIQGPYDTCTTNLSSGALDCCGDTEQWYCDSSVGCSQLNLLPVSANIGNGIGCVRVYPADVGYYEPGGLVNNFATQAECQKECRWKCDPSGNQVCTFVGYVPLIGSYPSAFFCYITTIDCHCASASTEWWCYDDHDLYSTGGGCISNISWMNPTQLNGVYGQGQVTQPAGGTAFSSFAECTIHCRFCCDETGGNGGWCELYWDGIGCCDVGCAWPSEVDCAINAAATGGYPCGPVGLYDCDINLGCIQGSTNIAPGSNGPWANLALCEAECAFDCNEHCVCEVTLTPDYSVTNPMNVFGAPWADIVDCVTAVLKDPCCPCDSCTTNSPIGVYWYDQVGPPPAWVTTDIYPIFTNPVPLWTPGTYTPTGQQGEVVMHDGCCFVVCDSHSAGSTYLNLSPTADYNEYVNSMASTNSSDWPSLMSGWFPFSSQIIYFPCDPACVKLTGSSQSWYCDANITTDTSNCVPDTGAWTAPYSDSVFGQGMTSYSNNPTNGFASHADCTWECRFCCKEVQGGGCKQCCRKQNSNTFYWDTTWPCKCNKNDYPVSSVNCKGNDGPDPHDEAIQMMNQTYLQTYNNETGNVSVKRGENGAVGQQGASGGIGSVGLQGANPCVPPVGGCTVPGTVWEGFLGGAGCCCCAPCVQNVSCNVGMVWQGPPVCACVPGTHWECELCWGNTSALATMYSCMTLTAPCGVDPCEVCTIQQMHYTIDDHIGFYNPTGTQGWSFNQPSFNGPWYPGLITTAYSDLYVTDPIDDCCYYNGTDYVWYSSNPTGAWVIPPSVCYANHLLGLFCDGSVNYFGNPLNTTEQQNIFPLWWPCDTTCPDATICQECDVNTPMWDASVQYAGGDLVLALCDDPVIIVNQSLYCCFMACDNVITCQGAPSIGQVPGAAGCEYWLLVCGCHEVLGCDCDPVPVQTSWQCMPGNGGGSLQLGGCYNLPGTNGYADSATCQSNCAEFLCTSDPYFSTPGASKCFTSNAQTIKEYVNAAGQTIQVNSPEEFANAMMTGYGPNPNTLVRFQNNTTTTIMHTLQAIDYTYINTQTPVPANIFQGCPALGGFRCTVDVSAINVAYGGFYGAAGYVTWSQTVLWLDYTFQIDISNCSTLDCARNIVLDPLHPSNNASVVFTMFSPSHRPCLCDSTSLDCTCLLIPGMGAPNAYSIANYTSCIDDCCQGLCEDCVPNLEGGNYIPANTTLTHRGLQSYYGNDTFAYLFNECITNPVDDCCVCCVDNNLGGQSDTHNGKIGDCHIDLIATPEGLASSISFYNGTNSGTGLWVWCGVNEDNDPASCPTGPVY